MSFQISNKRRRYNQIGLFAMDIPTILGQNINYETLRELLIRKIKGLINLPEADNWTNKYRSQVYKYLFNEDILLHHPIYTHKKYDWLCCNIMCNIIDNVLINIECPRHRNINEPVSKYLWIIIQVQLEILNLESCNYIQAEVYESNNESDWDKWNNDSTILKCGKYNQDNQLYYWCINNINEIKINRDRNWFEEQLPIINEYWNQILYYRDVGINRFVQDYPRNNIFGRTINIPIDNTNDNWDWDSMDYKIFLDLINSKMITNVNKNEWVTPSKLRDWFKNEPLLSWLKRNTIKEKSVFYEANRKNYSKFLIHRGHKFERSVYTYLSNTYKDDIIFINDPFIDNTYGSPINKVIDTFNALKKGIPIIIEATLYNPQNKTYGNADLLIRVDYISKIFNETKLNKNDIKIKANNINQIHYCVIDIKSRMLELSSDGFWFKGSCKGSIESAFKAQLGIYTQALGYLQGYRPNYAYILGTGYKYTKMKMEYRSNNSLDRLGKIEFNSRDSKILDYIPMAINWYRRLCKDGHNWTIYPKPCISELYPNMSNKEDAPFHYLKRKLADNIKEITQIRNCSVKHRENAHKHSIYSWNNPKLTPEILGFNKITKNGRKSIQYKQVKAILNTNRDTSEQIIFPKILKGNNMFNWLEKYTNDLYIDFEDTNLSFLDNFNNYPYVDSGQILFMIGIYYTTGVDNNKKYINFVSNDVSMEGEQIILRKWFEFMQNNLDPNQIIRIFHYSHHERTFFNKLKDKYIDLYNEFKSTLNRIQWVDIYKDIFLDNLICIKGALDWSLKSIAYNMKEHGLITAGWDKNSLCNNGAQANILAVHCHNEAYRLNISMNQLPLMKDTINYNKVDCETIMEIVECLRNIYK